MSAILDNLKADRAAAQGRLVALNAQRRRLTAAETVEAEARQDLAELDGQEIAAARAWAASASEGPPPAIDAERRAELVRDLARAETAAAAAKGAGDGVDREIADAEREIAGIGAKIEAAALDEIVVRHAAARSACQAQADTLRASTATMFGAIQFVQDRAQATEDAGRHNEARALFDLLGRMTEASSLDAQPTRGEVNASLPEWAAQFAELCR